MKTRSNNKNTVPTVAPLMESVPTTTVVLPTESAPTVALPTESAPTTPPPTESSPTTTTPTESSPTTTTPTESGSTTPPPTESAPTTPPPTESAPTTPPPTESAPTVALPTESVPTIDPSTESALQHLPMSSLENQAHLTSTPEKSYIQHNKDSSGHFDGDATLYESPLKMSPIKLCPLSPTNSYKSDDSCNDIRLFDDDDTENNRPYGLKAQKPRHDYSGRKRPKRVLFRKEKPFNVVPKKAKKQLVESKQLEDWITNINANFAEIDQYDLVIE